MIMNKLNKADEQTKNPFANLKCRIKWAAMPFLTLARKYVYTHEIWEIDKPHIIFTGTGFVEGIAEDTLLGRGFEEMWREKPEWNSGLDQCKDVKFIECTFELRPKEESGSTDKELEKK